MRVAIIGGGTIATLFIEHIRQGDLGDAQVVAVVGRNDASRGKPLADENYLPNHAKFIESAPEFKGKAVDPLGYSDYFLTNTYDANSRVCRQVQADASTFTFYYIPADQAALARISKLLFEGHPDNVAPAFHGGFVISGREDDSRLSRQMLSA